MDREAATKQMKSMYAKARAARKDGKRAAASAFKAGGRRLQRKIAAIPKPVEKKAEEEG